MTTITDKAVRAAIAQIDQTSTNRTEFKEPGPRGSGRLVLVVRKHKTGVAAEWFAQWFRDGRKHMTKLGDFPVMTVAAAREIFRTQVSPEIVRGKNPSGPRAWVRNTGPTVKELFEAYIAYLADNGRKPGSVRTATYVLLGPSGIVHELGGKRPPNSITTDDIRQVLRRIKSRGASHSASNARAFIKAAFQYAIKCKFSYHWTGPRTDWGIDANPASPIPTDPAAFVPGARALSIEEFSAFWHWLTQKGRSFRYRYAPAVQLMMATGQRPSEILRLRPDLLDQHRRELLWPTTKNGRPHSVPLPDQLWQLVLAQVPNDVGWLFPKQRKSEECAESGVTEWIIGRYLTETGALHFTARDLRRTWKTLAGAAGLSKDIRDRLQNHALNDVSAKHYDRYDYAKEKLAAMDQWCTFLAEMLTGQPDGKFEFAQPVRVTPPPEKTKLAKMWRQALKDGVIDAATLAAIRAFEASHGQATA